MPERMVFPPRASCFLPAHRLKSARLCRPAAWRRTPLR